MPQAGLPVSLPGREPWQGQGRFAPVARRLRRRPRPDLQLLCGCDPRDVRAAIDKLDVNGAPRLNPSPAPARAKRKTTTADALDLWREAQPVNGTPVEIYLRARGFREPVPATIRFLPRYPYSSRKSFACMIAAVQAPTREIVAVQLTFLHSGGQRKADVLEPRRAIGPLGAGALRLAPVAEHIGLAEGFETAWAAQLLHDMPVWRRLETNDI